MIFCSTLLSSARSSLFFFLSLSLSLSLSFFLHGLICGGVFERFPEVRVVVSEFETGWVAHFLRRLDHAIYRTRSTPSTT